MVGVLGVNNINHFLKTINYFLKIKEEFFVKEKMFSVVHYFAAHQTPKIIKKTFFVNYFMAKQMQSSRIYWDRMTLCV
jgi:hypothetical protein